MKILFLEPFYGGSHKDFALGFQETCPYEVILQTMPDRFWKWRMRGAGLHFAGIIKNISEYDLIFATDMMDLTDFIALAGTDLPPVWLYFHENQLSYPLSPGERRDYHLGFTNIVSAIAADQVFFNSYFHLNSFLTQAGRLIHKLPDFQPNQLMEQIQDKTTVVYPGCRFPSSDGPLGDRAGEPPLIIWNHRWEHDKNPDPFFNALSELKKNKTEFSLAVVGENFSQSPPIFEKAKHLFDKELIEFGYLESREEYVELLKKGSIVVSCANQENFGISIVEAVRYGCLPLLPDRLSYPEIMPDYSHDHILYQDDNDLAELLEKKVKQLSSYSGLRSRLSADMKKFSWDVIMNEFITRIFHENISRTE